MPLGVREAEIGMAYDVVLAARIRTTLDGTPDLTEKKMFGGLAFLVGGNMAVAARGEGGLMVRVNPSEADTLIADSTARPVEMRGRVMLGWLHLDQADVDTDETLVRWVTIGTTYARSLPAKR